MRDLKSAETIFASAAQLPPGPARREYLRDAVGADQALLLDVEKLLDLHDDAGSFLELPAWERDPTLLSRWNTTSQQHELSAFLSLLKPSLDSRALGSIKHFTVLRSIGQGGTSLVFLARDEQLDREVALKMLNPALASQPQVKACFLKEARAIASLRNDKVVSIYDVGEEQGVPYFVMEYLPFGSLQDFLKTHGPLSMADSLIVIQQVAEALQATHAKGLLHRDIKPSNVLIAHFPGRIKLSDFGLALSANDPTSDLVIGTPQYSSPEQLLRQPVDQRSDLFSLGCLGYALLIGRSPFAGVSGIQTIQLTLQSSPEPLTRFGLVPPTGLEQLLRQLVAKDPAERPKNIQEVLDSLQMLPSGAAITRTGFPNPSRARRQGAHPIVRRTVLAAGLAGAGWGALKVVNLSRFVSGPPLLAAEEPTNFSLFDNNLADYLHLAENVVLVDHENDQVPQPNYYWRCQTPDTVGTIIYRFPFRQRLSRCLAHVQAYVTFGFDPKAWLRVSASADAQTWYPLYSFKLERCEWWKAPGVTSSTPMIPQSSANTMISQMPQQDLTRFMRNQSVLYLKAELYAVELLPDNEGGTLGPAAAQFLRCRPDNAKDPLKFIPQA